MVSGGPAPEPGTLNELFFESAQKYDKPDALMVKRGEVISIMERLEALGASAILETQITNCRL